MSRRSGTLIATALLALLLFILCGPCGGDDATHPKAPAGNGSGEAAPPPPVVPNGEAAMPSPDVERVRRHGRIHRPEGHVAVEYDVFLTGPGMVRRLEAYRRRGMETVAGGIRPVRLADGFLPPAWKAGRTAPDGGFEVTWEPGFQGRVDLLFATRDAEGQVRIRHRIAGAEAGLPGAILIPKSGSIEGRILTENGEPVEKALVYCLPLDVLLPGEMKTFCRHASPFTGLFLVDWARHAQTGKDGRYRIGGLRPAPYRVFARRRDRGGEIRRVDVVSGKPNADRDIVLDIEGAYVRGLVADEETSDPIPGCFVAADDPQGTTMSDADGTYEIGPLAPGDFRGFILKTDYEMSVLGPFELVEGRTFAAPTTYLTRKK